jgi:neutral ceramidase
MSRNALNYKAGAASVCITPDEPLWLAGYAVRKAPANGKISELYASALVLEDGTGQQFVIASLEIVSVNSKIAEKIADQVRARHGLSRQQLMLTATHTHYAPEYRADKQLFFHIPAEYAAKFSTVEDRLVAAMTRAIDEAVSRLEPVRLFAHKTTAGFAHNRRRHGVKAGTPSAADIFDHDVPMLECVDASGNRKAIVFGYACHCTTIPPEDLRYCGDWAGFAKEQLQQANPSATALFIPGAGADQDPEPRASLELSQQYGRELSLAVQKALDEPGVEIAGPMRMEWEEVQLELEPVTHDKIEKMLASDDPPQLVKGEFLLDLLDRGEKLITSYCAPIQVVDFGGEMLLIGLSGEPVVDWAHKFKQQYGPGRGLVWVAGYCNDVFDYVPNRRIQTERGYEGGRANLWNWIPTPFTEDVEDRITTAVRRLVERVSESP